MIKLINFIIKKLKKYSWFEENNIYDGYHTFNELYEFRKQYNAALFNSWSEQGKYEVHKSWKHYDGEKMFWRRLVYSSSYFT